jgi:hypothetical protein
MDYKNKYLKYKNKYLQLKNQLIGGTANCPQNGFHHHIDECAHDSFLMIALYSDNFSEHIQKLFDHPSFNIEECMAEADRNSSNHFLMPIQIEPETSVQFHRYSKDYLQNIYERYKNEKLKYADEESLLALSSIRQRLRPIYAAPTEPVKPRTLERIRRRDSINESLSCNYALNKITNINILEDRKKTYTHNKHARTYLHLLTNIGLINYYLTNYRPRSIYQSERDIALDRKQFLSATPVNLYEIFLIDKLDTIDDVDSLFGIMEQINMRLRDIFHLISEENVIGVNLDMYIKSQPEESGHYVSFIKCK